MKIVRKITGLLLVTFVVAQFFGPEKNEGNLSTISAFVSETAPSEEVLKLLKESCFDCHTNKTRYPWYGKITPVNYWMENHVKVGKKKLNFSKWSAYSLKRKEHKSEELYEMVEKKEMPLPSYRWTHKEANLSQAQIDALVSWARRLQTNYKAALNSK
ncbi:MAG: heme-binding domain-containing protein [Polaribacter sp.]|nr:heme-binding domain-containing protein [Polaribacter sp.]